VKITFFFLKNKAIKKVTSQSLYPFSPKHFMFDNSLISGASTFPIANNSFSGINENVENIDIITPNAGIKPVFPVGESYLNLEKSSFASEQAFRTFPADQFQLRATKSKIDSLTGQGLQTTTGEPNDSLIGASNLDNLTQTSLTINDSLNTTDINDYYRFNLTSTSNLSLNLNGLSANADLELLDNSGRVIQRVAKTGTAAETLNRQLAANNLTDTSTANDYYHVRVYNNASGSTNYTLNLSSTIADSAGNTLSTARDLGNVNGSKRVTDYVGSIDTDDYYRFSVADTSRYSVSLTELGANADVQLLNSNGSVIQSAVNTGTTAEAMSGNLNAGTYFLRVFPNESANTNYTVKLTANIIDNAGNTLSTARNTGTLSGTKTFSDAVSSVDTNDYYRFTVANASTFNLALNGLSADANVELLDVNGAVVQNSTNTGSTAEAISTNLNAGDYFVRVFPNGSISTSYNLSLTSSPLDTVGNSLADARNLGTLDGTQTVSDFIGGTDMNDYYRFTLANKSEFNLALKGLSADADVQLLASNGSKLKESSLGGSSAEAISTTLNAGEYFVRVFPFGSSNTNYNLSLTATPIITPTTDSLTAQWYVDNLRDLEIRNLTQSLANDSELNRADAIAILSDAKDGNSISADELRDLRVIVANATAFNMNDAVRVLTNKVVNGNVANQKFQGQTLGNLAADSTDIQMENLIGKWFYGSDRPTTLSTSHTYRQFSGSLFQNGINIEDIKQGQVGDCYYLSTLASIAQEKPSFIQEMFTDNGDGTFTVRFYNNSVADYVTVDRFLASDSNSRLVYASAGASATNTANELWVALAEKAYAQLAESGWSRSVNSTNSYAAIEGGWMDTVIRQVTSLSTGDSTVNSMTKQQLIDLANSDKILTAGFVNGSNYGIINNHAYTIASYNAETDTFRMRNPWATQHADLTWQQLLDLKAYIQWSNV
jgi:hypothetical protein